MSFEPKNRALGVCYYPEHWPEENWADDARRMVTAGISWVRIGEFAWSRIEPTPGTLTWDWLDRAIDVLGQAGLKIILGTPSATPPRWMLGKWPDMLPVGKDGQARKFGSRRHYCFSHKGYRGEAARMARLLGERYGRSAHVKAWQIDNEYDCHDTALSYSDAARTGFRTWLAKKYDTISALNEAWGNVFWSMDYAAFDEIDLPNQTVTEANPAHVLDFRRYASDMVVAFNRAQTDALRGLTDAPLIHNFMGRITGFDHFKVGADLDIAGWDSYPLGKLEESPDQSDDWKTRFLRQGDPDFQAFHHDLYRAVGNGRIWVMEQQPGPVNWAAFNPAPLPGMVRLWAWEAFAHGAETVSFFRWRQVPFAQEQMHAGLLQPDGSAAPAMAEITQLAHEMTEMPKAQTARASVALIFDYTSQWAWETQPQGADFDYFRLVFDFYRGLRALGQTIDILPADAASFEGYDLVLAPGLFRVPPQMRRAMASFGGTFVAGPRFGSKTEDMKIPAAMPPDFSDFHCRVERVESLRPGVCVPLEQGGTFTSWVESIKTDLPAIELTSDSKPARVGTAKRQYIAGWPDQTALKRILSVIARDCDLETRDLPDGVRCRDTQSHRFFFNYGADAASVDGLDLAPASVTWKHL